MKIIKIDKDTYLHTFVHTLTLSLEEHLLLNEHGYFTDYNKVANELIDALEGNECVALLESIHKISGQRIVEHWEKYAPDRLGEEKYKRYLEFKNYYNEE